MYPCPSPEKKRVFLGGKVGLHLGYFAEGNAEWFLSPCRTCMQHAYFSQPTNQVFNFVALSVPFKNKNVSFSFQFKVTLPVPEVSSETEKVLVIILSSVGGAIFLAVVASILIYFYYWKKRRKSETKQETELTEGNVNFVPFEF